MQMNEEQGGITKIVFFLAACVSVFHLPAKSQRMYALSLLYLMGLKEPMVLSLLSALYIYFGGDGRTVSIVTVAHHLPNP